MPLSVVNNLAAFAAQKSVVKTTEQLQNALTQLSTGLRINSAADDPSGLAISERFRTQIKGLHRATQNAMDAQTMLQVAEGSLAEVQSILQRMRELAVQAANGVLISSDRQEIQREVDQLKEEIDRIANSTEFNTKKLLDGSATGLWSTDKDDIEAIITGKVREGNYKLVKDNEPLSNHVLKSDIFKIKDGAISQREDGAPNQFRFVLGGVDGEVSGDGTLTVGFSFNEGLSFITVDITTLSGGTPSVSGGFTDAEVLVRTINAHASLNQWIEAELVSGGHIVIRSKEATDISDSFRMQFAAGVNTTLSSWVEEIQNWRGETISASAELFSGTGSIQANGGIRFSDFDLVTTGSGADLGAGTFGTDNQDPAGNTVVESVANASQLSSGQYDIVTVDNTDLSNTLMGTGWPDLGEENAFLLGAYRTENSTAVVTSITAHTLSENAYAIIEITGDGGDGEVDFRISWDQGITWTEYMDYTTSGAANRIRRAQGSDDNLFSLSFTGEFKVGDRLLIGLQDNLSSNSHVARLTGPPATWTRVTSNDSGWDAREGLAGADFPSFNHGLWVDLGTTGAGVSTTLTLATMDEEGRVVFGEMDVTFGETFESRSNNITVLGSGDAAGPDTLLSQVDRFYDDQGNFVLGEGGKWISIYTADGDNASFYLDAGDTIQELADKIEQIICLDQTEQGWEGLNIGQALDEAGINHVTDFVVNAVPNSDEAVPGTIVIRSPKQGPGGHLFFSAEEPVLKALSLATIRDPSDQTDPLTVEVYDAHTGELIGMDTVSDNILHGVIQGVDVVIDPNVDVSFSWNSITRQIDFYSSPGKEEEYLHVVDASTDFQIGANPGQVMEAYIAQMDTLALGVQTVMVVNQDASFRALEDIDAAINLVSTERARMGAYINRLDHTITSLAVQEENQIAAESTLRDLDMASAISELTQIQILQQVGVAMLAQANAVPQALLTLFG